MIHLALLLLALWAPLTQAESFSFGALGDTPFDEAERQQLPELLAQMHAAGARFAVHVGNLKPDDVHCDDAAFAAQQTLFSHAPLPVVFVPGDNDWLACAREAAGSYKIEERLAALRQLFFATPHALGPATLALERQSSVNFAFGAYREHQRWQTGPVLFLTLNIPGGDNNIGRPLLPNAEFRHRLAAARDWLESSFALARQQGLRGVAVFLHANPDFEAYAENAPAPAYRELLEALRLEAERYTGEVLLVHGDTRVMRVDRPLKNAEGETLQHFRRLEVFGSPILGWVEVTVDTDAPRLFRIRSKPLHPDAAALGGG